MACWVKDSLHVQSEGDNPGIEIAKRLPCPLYAGVNLFIDMPLLGPAAGPCDQIC